MSTFHLLIFSPGRGDLAALTYALARRVVPDDISISCAGESPGPFDPTAAEVLAEVGVPLEASPAPLSRMKDAIWDAVLMICDHPDQDCPTFATSPAVIRWFIADPGTTADGRPRAEAWRAARNEIVHKISHLVEDGYLDAIRRQRLILGSLLDHMVDGVLAHDSDRRIFYFNAAAQHITGYSYDEVIGRECHDIFPGRFCGGHCADCDPAFDPGADRRRYHTTFRRRDGKLIDLEMSTVTIPTGKDSRTSLVLFRSADDDRDALHPLPTFFQGMVGKHPVMVKVYDTIREVANVKVPVLIQGESGTGKQMVAEAIHRLSARAGAPFVPVNCGALPESLLESELFGHVRGAFTGAVRDKRGRFALADRGTIFLDEIGEISPAMQVKLLGVLESMSFVPVGAEKPVQVDVRVICATNRDLKKLTDEGHFREDLYYRLAVMPITLPPLRQRTSDIPDLVEYFLRRYAAEIGRSTRQVSTEAMELLVTYPWPGNIRELGNAVRYALIKCHDAVLRREHLPPEIVTGATVPSRPTRRTKFNPQSVKDALERSGGNKKRAAEILGVTRPTLYAYLRKIDNTFT